MNSEIAAILKPWFPDLNIEAVQIITDGPVCWCVRRLLKQGAITIAPYVFFAWDEFIPNKAWSLALLAHELKHIEQYRAMGRLNFLWTYLRDRLKAGHYSHDLPLEVAPYALQTVVHEALQTRFP